MFFQKLCFQYFKGKENDTADIIFLINFQAISNNDRWLLTVAVVGVISRNVTQHFPGTGVPEPRLKVLTFQICFTDYILTAMGTFPTWYLSPNYRLLSGRTIHITDFMCRFVVPTRSQQKRSIPARIPSTVLAYIMMLNFGVLIGNGAEQYCIPLAMIIHYHYKII